MSEKNADQESIHLTTGAEATMSDDAGTVDVQIKIADRDPMHMNDHIKVTFHDIIAEPDRTVYSFEKVWVLSYKVFTMTKVWTYRILTLICALPFSFVWGVYFACLGFCNIWVCMPCIKSYMIELYCIRRIWEVVLATFYRPCFEAMGACLSSIMIRIQRD